MNTDPDTNTPASAYCLDHVSDDNLHVSTRRLVGRSNRLFAALLAHLAEVEARGIHRERACGSLYTYCIYELRMSEDAAFRRARASKIARQFPILFEQVAAGEIHLTGVLMLGPHLTEENHLEVLARAKHRTKKEIAHLVRVLNPLPDVRALVEPLGPPTRSIIANPTWSQMVEAHSPPVRELAPGDRPKDWSDHDASEDDVRDDDVGDDDADAGNGAANPDSELSPSLALVPQRYKVQFTATQEYVDLLEAAKDLLAHAVPGRSIEEVHLRAMRALVTELKKLKTGATNKPRAETPSSPTGPSGAAERCALEDRADSRPSAPVNPRQRGTNASANPRQRGTNVPVNPRQHGANASANPRQRGRYVPRAVRRAVWERDGERCTYVDATGQRCRETGGLEMDHVQPHARGGPPTVANLRLRCLAHNALTAENDFGRDFIAQKKGEDPLEAGLP